jgi:hydroxymethylglutaryl-CoA lyase
VSTTADTHRTTGTAAVRPEGRVELGHVQIVEVSPRDGLQSDPTPVGTDAKVELISRAVRAGLRRIETVSFVNPARVPQMADAEAVMAALHADDSLAALHPSYIGLVLNRRGLDRAVATGVHEVNAVAVCSDTFALKNQGKDTAGLVADVVAICADARAAGLPVSVTLAASFGCPYEGEVPIDRLRSVLERVVAAGPDEVALADSIGVATPIDVRERVELAQSLLDGTSTSLRCHFHNTRNTGLANATAAVESGVRVLDSSLGGIGGCPFAPNATGNVPTEDLAYLLERMGWSTGVDLDAAVAVVPWLEQVVEHPVPGYLAKAGVFPASALGAAAP